MRIAALSCGVDDVGVERSGAALELCFGSRDRAEHHFTVVRTANRSTRKGDGGNRRLPQLHVQIAERLCGDVKKRLFRVRSDIETNAAEDAVKRSDVAPGCVAWGKRYRFE